MHLIISHISHSAQEYRQSAFLQVLAMTFSVPACEFDAEDPDARNFPPFKLHGSRRASLSLFLALKSTRWTELPTSLNQSHFNNESVLQAPLQPIDLVGRKMVCVSPLYSRQDMSVAGPRSQSLVSHSIPIRHWLRLRSVGPASQMGVCLAIHLA